MTNTSLIQRRDLEKASDQDRYRLYFERYGITPEEIANETQMLLGDENLYKRLIEERIDKDFISQA